MSKILIIGNGFDLSHGLPTKYEDFLDFCILWDHMIKYKGLSRYNDAVTNLKKAKTQIDVDSIINRHVENAIGCVFESQIALLESDYSTIGNIFKKHTITEPVSGKAQTIKEIFEGLITNNVWIEYFGSVRGIIGENWIDFETEISDVLNHLNEIEKMPAADAQKSKYKVIKVAYTKWETEYATKLVMNDENRLRTSFVDKLYNDLNALIRALEIYFSVVVENIEVKERQAVISNEQFDLVLSFNYTDTYRRVYQPEMDDKHICFIHGKAKLENSIESCNLILGVQKTIKKDDEEDPAMLVFKKYYQRIFRGTDSRYLDWLTNLERFKDQKYDISIFGHSLDVTDQEVLKSFIDNKRCKTTIYHHNRASMGLQIRNLFQFIDHDTMIRMSGGVSPSIRFLSQNEV